MGKNLNKKEIIILIISLLIFLSALFFFIINNNLDKTPDIYYRTYTKEQGWSKWCKNGKISGNGINKILNIELKLEKGIVEYSLYKNEKWITSPTKKNSEVFGFKSQLNGPISNEYILYYRTYNKKDKWLGWTNYNEISGNKKESISKIQIKLLLKDSSLDDKLEDFSTGKEKSINFEGGENDE